MGNKPIVHAPIATGSTEPRDIRDRFADFVNLKDFGAVGDGITNDSTAWAAWRTALQSGGMPYIPAGNYLLGNELIHVPKGHIGRNTTAFSYDDGTTIDEFTAPIFIDASNGDDDNDGFTESTAVQTINRALELCGNNKICQNITLYIAQGTYNEDVVISGTTVIISLIGNVTINGCVDLSKGASLSVAQTSTYSLTVGSLLLSWSIAHIECDFTVFSNNAEYSLAVTNNSYCHFTKNLTISGVSTIRHIQITHDSVLIIDGNTSLAGSSVAAIQLLRNSVLYCAGTLNISTACSSGCMSAYYGSQVFLGSSVTISGSHAGLLHAYYQSTVSCNGLFTANVAKDYNGAVAYYMSVIDFSGGLSLTAPSSSANAAVFAIAATYLSRITVSTSLKVNGYYSRIVYVSVSSSFALSNSAAVSGSPTGQRYAATVFSAINIGGHDSGANRIPGSSAGTPAPINASQSNYYS